MILTAQIEYIQIQDLKYNRQIVELYIYICPEIYDILVYNNV